MSVTQNVSTLPPLTLSNLLASGENGRKLVSSITSDISFDCHGVTMNTGLKEAIFNRHKLFEDGFVYLLWAEGTDYYKIGKSIDPGKRLKQISPKMPFQTHLVGHIETNCMSFLEAHYHFLCWDSRANGEWFRLKPDEVMLWRDQFLQGLSVNLESILGSYFFFASSENLWGWMYDNFQVDTHKGSYAGLYQVASEIADVLTIQQEVFNYANDRVHACIF